MRFKEYLSKVYYIYKDSGYYESGPEDITYWDGKRWVKELDKAKKYKDTMSLWRDQEKLEKLEHDLVATGEIK
jgi:hypothetical protein